MNTTEFDVLAVVGHESDTLHVERVIGLRATRIDIRTGLPVEIIGRVTAVTADQAHDAACAAYLNAKTLAFELGCDAIAALCSPEHPAAHAAYLAADGSLQDIATGV